MIKKLLFLMSAFFLLLISGHLVFAMPLDCTECENKAAEYQTAVNDTTAVENDVTEGRNLIETGFDDVDAITNDIADFLDTEITKGFLLKGESNCSADSFAIYSIFYFNSEAYCFPSFLTCFQTYDFVNDLSNTYAPIYAANPGLEEVVMLLYSNLDFFGNGVKTLIEKLTVLSEKSSALSLCYSNYPDCNVCTDGCSTTGGLCVNNECLCTESGGCAGGYTCVATLCAEKCTVTADCLEGFECTEGGCVALPPECTVDSDCAEGFFCDANACVAISTPPLECEFDVDCAAGETCAAGVCETSTPECITNADCTAPETCETGFCVIEGMGYPPVETGFTDIADHWAKTYIERLFGAGVISGKTPTIFAPNDPVSRAELTKIGVKAFGHDIAEPRLVFEENAFTDVNESDWFFNYVNIAESLGCVEGYDDNTFRPNTYVQRVEALKIIICLAGMNVDDPAIPQATFPDLIPNAWYTKYVNYAQHANIISGYEDGNFGPANNLLRGEVAKITGLLMFGG
jgi:Cys-rich repeat protein